MRIFPLKNVQTLGRCAALWLLLAAGTAFADTSKISPDLQPLLANSNSSINVIVQYQPQSSGGLLGGLLNTVTNLLGGVLNLVFTLLNAGTATLHPSDIINLSTNRTSPTFRSTDSYPGRWTTRRPRSTRPTPGAWD